MSTRCPTCGAIRSDIGPVISSGEAARRLKVSKRTVIDWIRKGLLRTINPGGHHRISVEDVEALVMIPPLPVSPSGDR